jgi:isoquinoline 1-oxidoreductase subunit alpha
MITLKVNGTEHQVAVEEDTPLLWVIRDSIGLTGTKFACGVGACGACTVLMGDEAVRSCLIPVAAVGTMMITTIEGLSRNRDHVLQRAWIDAQVPQCGYCQSGMLMAAAALLQRNPHPDDAAIAGAMTNICRCGTYQRIRQAIKAAAEQTP